MKYLQDPEDAKATKKVSPPSGFYSSITDYFVANFPWTFWTLDMRLTSVSALTSFIHSSCCLSSFVPRRVSNQRWRDAGGRE